MIDKWFICRACMRVTPEPSCEFCKSIVGRGFNYVNHTQNLKLPEGFTIVPIPQAENNNES